MATTYFLYSGAQDKQTPEQQKPQEAETRTGGRISSAFSRAIAYERTPTLFDDGRITKRDQILKEDAALGISRKDKPLYLTPTENRLVTALSMGISREIALEEIHNKIVGIRENSRAGKSLTKGTNTISRGIDIEAIATYLYGSENKKKSKAKVIADLFSLGRKTQIMMLGENKKSLRPVISTLIQISSINLKPVDGETTSLSDIADFMRTASPTEIADKVETIDITFGVAFFFNLDTRYAYLPENTFEVWRKKGRQTELYSELFSSLLAVYWQMRKTADEREKDFRKEMNRLTRISKEDYEKQVKEIRREAMAYELNVENIKKRVVADYDSTRQYRAKFWKDLDNAVEGFIELGLLTDYYRVKGARGQEKVIFYLSDSYNFEENKALPQFSETKEGQGEEETGF